jgi:hemerythrin
MSDTGPELDRLVRELVRVLRTHFRDEEQFMMSIGYPESAGHRWQHELLIADAEALEGKLSSGSTSLVAAVRLLDVIVLDHAKETDSEMFQYHDKLTKKS